MSLPSTWDLTIERYGPHERQIVERYKPRSSVGAHVLPITMIHGGYWRNKYRLDLMHPLAGWLVDVGYEVRNVEYRSIGDNENPWPTMSADIKAALRLTDQPQLLVGHSAGGHLALWAASTVPELVAGVVALAPVSDLAVAYSSKLSNNATGELLGTSPTADPELYRLASPAEQLPLGVRQLVVHGKADDAVPPEMSVAYVDAARAAGDIVSYLDLDEVDHFDIIDPQHRVWVAIRRWIDEQP